jgi:hypothetical protein
MIETIKRQLVRIQKGEFTHAQITVMGHGLLGIFQQFTICSSPSAQEDAEFFLRMMSNHAAPHHARREFARQCWEILIEEGGINEKKVDESGEPRSGQFLTESPDDIPF